MCDMFFPDHRNLTTPSSKNKINTSSNLFLPEEPDSSTPSTSTSSPLPMPNASLALSDLHSLSSHLTYRLNKARSLISSRGIIHQPSDPIYRHLEREVQQNRPILQSYFDKYDGFETGTAATKTSDDILAEFKADVKKWHHEMVDRVALKMEIMYNQQAKDVQRRIKKMEKEAARQKKAAEQASDHVGAEEGGEFAMVAESQGEEVQKPTVTAHARVPKVTERLNAARVARVRTRTAEEVVEAKLAREMEKREVQASMAAKFMALKRMHEHGEAEPRLPRGKRARCAHGQDGHDDK